MWIEIPATEDKLGELLNSDSIKRIINCRNSLTLIYDLGGTDCITEFFKCPADLVTRFKEIKAILTKAPIIECTD